MSNTTNTTAKARHRSPSYPSINLGKAIEFVQAVYNHEKRNEVASKVIAQHWNYKPTSSGFSMNLSALKKYGLMEGHTKVKLTDRALDIILRNEDSPSRKSAIREAALSPKIHKDLWEKYSEHGLPSDNALREYMVADLNFNENYVNTFIKNLRSTFQFAKIETSNSDLDVNNEPDPKNESTASIATGAFVQWTSQGIEQFPEPKQVKGVSEDGQWAFVEGTDTGLPMSDLTLTKHPGTKSEPERIPPPNPYAKAKEQQKEEIDDDIPREYARERFTTEEGPVTLEWPLELSKDSVEDIEHWMESVMRRARRKAGVVPSQ